MGRGFVVLVAGLMAAFSPEGAAFAGPASRDAAPEEFRMWVDARAGTGPAVHWIAEGGVYDYPSGKKILGMIGFDTSTVIWPETAGGEVVHLTRKTFAYTDPDTGEILTEYKGKKVEPVAYPYQMITYRMEGGRIFGDVEQGAGKAVQKIKAEDGMTTRWMGKDTLAVTAPVFLNFPLPGGGQYQAWENYDFFIDRNPAADEPHKMSWQRYGAMPPFAGEGQAIYHLLSWRVESEGEFPEKLLAWAKKEKPMWLKPPQSVDEVRKLQSGQMGEGWAK